MGRLRVGVLVSGRGSNLQALLDATGSGEVPAEIVVVVSNHADAYALRRAQARGVSTAVLERKEFPSRAAHQRAIADVLRRAEADLVVLAGFDRVLGPEFIAAYPLQIVNIHPSLLPAFGGGLHAQADALAYGAKVSGCTVHFVTDDVDAGPIILQATVPVLDEDTADTLAARILEQEHRILPRAVGLIAEDRLVVEGRRVSVKPGEAPVRQ
ncbi:MAG: phosphoribosylglycinamide formyltransferase [Chloroflexota bacterium]